jgi:putative sterol carrier protein
MTCADVFQNMDKRFQELGLRDVYGVFQFDISGPGGGRWHAQCQGDSVRVQPGTVDRPDVTILTSAENVVKLASGKMNPTLALLTRKVRLKGNLVLAARMQGLLQKVI